MSGRSGRIASVNRVRMRTISAPLLVLQLLELVIDLDDLDRLDVNRLAGSRLVVDEPFDLSLVSGRDRNHGPSVADRDRGVGVDQAGSLRRTP